MHIENICPTANFHVCVRYSTIDSVRKIVLYKLIFSEGCTRKSMKCKNIQLKAVLSILYDEVKFSLSFLPFKFKQHVECVYLEVI